MHSRVEIVADVGDDGRPVLVRLRGEGQFAVRPTGAASVHLVGTAAGPLGGDSVEVSVQVRAGARLEVHGVAATLALPGAAGGIGRVTTELQVADGGLLRYAPSPLVVCRNARTRTTTAVTVEGRGAADVAECVVLGRHAEPGGDWRGRLIADRDATPLLRTTTHSAVVQDVGVGDPVRAVVSRLLTGGGAAVPTRGCPTRGCPTHGCPTRGCPTHGASTSGSATRGMAVRCPLGAGGVLITALGTDLTSALADLDALRNPTVDRGADIQARDLHDHGDLMSLYRQKSP